MRKWGSGRGFARVQVVGSLLLVGMLGSLVAFPRALNGGRERLERLSWSLGGKELRDLDLRGWDLRGANLAHAKLVNVDLRGADLREANLSDARLERCDLRGARLTGADVVGVAITSCDFRETEFCPSLMRARVDATTRLPWHQCWE